MPKRNDGGELEARWLSREEMEALMKRIRDSIAEAEATRNRELEEKLGPRLMTGVIVYPVEEEERRDELRRQANQLAEEGESK